MDTELEFSIHILYQKYTQKHFFNTDIFLILIKKEVIKYE